MQVTAAPDPGARSGRFRLPRPEVSAQLLNLLIATYLLATCNATYWGKLVEIFGDRPVAMVTLALAVWALFMLVVSLLAVGWLQKPMLAFLVVLAAVTSFYQDKLGVIIDREMIQNALTTTVNEGKHLITPNFLLHVLLRAVPGLVLVFWPRVRRRSFLRGTLAWVLTCGAAAAMVVGLLFTDLKGFSTSLRGRKDLIGSTQPLAPLGGAIRYARLLQKSAKIVTQPFGRDATKGPRLAGAGKPVLMVIVAGETGRAQNWSLGGYGRDTNPDLAKRDILYFSNVTSCGTATATSLPCMFSHLTRDEYSYEAGLAYENLLDVLSHAGVHVEWWDNNTGDKDIANRVPSRMMTKEDDAAACAEGECIDAVFLPRLAKVAETMTEDTVIVLHQIGSHGPSYWLRYPKDQEVFKPACHSPELATCSPEEIVNAYDNTIRYTDRFLSQVIDMLAGQDRVIPAMFYVSDHGESLGEGGLYLHGAPWFMAPEFQTHVPMVIWTPPAFRNAMGLDQACIGARKDQPASHDNMFATILGLMDIKTEVRDDALDLTAGCKGQES